MTDNIDECVDDLIKLFSKKSDLKLEQIVAEPSLQKYSRDPQIIYLAVYRIISDEIPIMSIDKHQQRLVYSQGYYIVDERYFKNDKSGQRIKLADVKTALPKRTMKVNLTPSVGTFVEKMTFKSKAKEEDIDIILKKLFTGEIQIWNLSDKQHLILYSFVWEKHKTEKMHISQIIETRMRELLPEYIESTAAPIEELLSKATDKSMEPVRIKASIMIIEWYLSEVFTNKGYWYSVSDKVFKLFEYEKPAFVERLPGSGEHNALLRRFDICSKTKRNSDLLQIY